MRRTSEEQRGKPEECVVRLWQGYVFAQFHACFPGAEEPFLISPSFRTWHPPWRPEARPDDAQAAAEAFDALRGELVRQGWKDAGDDSSDEHVFLRGRAAASRIPPVAPASIAEHALLRALDQVAGENGATAAELGRALYGDRAPTVQYLPQRLGSRLRSLQQQGKVARHETNGHSHWFTATRDADAGLTGHGNGHAR
jgi:hypothetical protein